MKDIQLGVETGFSYIPPKNGTDVPLIIDSPHSGRNYPTDFDYDCDLEQLRLLEDISVDSLINGLEKQGAHLLKANFPRSYIDFNRPKKCLDPNEISGGLQELEYEIEENARYLKHGTGLIFMGSFLHKFNIYAADNKPTEQDIMHRMTYWENYHTKLKSLFNDITQRHGHAYLMDIHSCNRQGTKKRRADILIGTNEGLTCSTDFTNAVVKAFTDHGLSVDLNGRFKGRGTVLNHHTNPAENNHTLEIEICRDLYMNEGTFELNEDKAKQMRKVLKNVTRRAIDHIQANNPSSRPQLSA